MQILNTLFGKRNTQPKLAETAGGRPNIYVQSLTFNDGTTLSVSEGDIVVFVGPNNVGKSQTLKDIHSWVHSQTPTVMLKAVDFSADSFFDYTEWLDRVASSKKDKYGHYLYSHLNVDIPRSFVKIWRKTQLLDRLSDLLICLLKTEERLTIADPPDNVNWDEPAMHPIHLLRRTPMLREKISAKFEQAFGMSIVPFDRSGRTTPLVLGPYPDFSNKFDNEIARQEAVDAILSKYPHLEDQGDGMRSFVGLMLYLIIDHYNTFLIDEPEAFLHPPQARIMGETVGNLLSNKQQAFISTHSIHFILSLLDQCPQRVKIVRITRLGNSNKFLVLDNDKICQLSKDPFLKYSNALEGLFYSHVILCEADTDCMFYSMLHGADDMQGAKARDTLFVHCGGKQRMATVVRSLRDLHIDFRVVPDFDVLNDQNTLKGLIESCGGDWSEYEKSYNVMDADIRNRSKNDKSASQLLAEIEGILSKNSKAPVSNSQRAAIKHLLEKESAWDRLKKSGVAGIPSGEPRQACDILLESLKTIGIHVVPCGELERFVPTCGGHGPSWIQDVLEKHPDMSDDVFDNAKEFIRSWGV